MTLQNTDFIVNKNNLADVQLVQTTLPAADSLSAGQALLKVDTFSFTANNISYGVLGDAFGYWDFFPAQEGWGRIPVWGFADVLASTVDGLAQGDRLYGYLPMSTHLLIEPGRMSADSFLDIAEHRKERSPIYNQYTFTAADPAYKKEHEGLISLFRPLFTTSFLLDVFHANNDFFGANTIMLSSASSKTAIGLASLLAKREGVTVVGLTSESNTAFVESLGYYDKVVSYDAVESLPVTAAAYVDMAGNGEVLARVHQHFGDNLKKSSLVGATHWSGRAGASDDMPGATPEVFFAPGFAQVWIKEIGMEQFQAQIGAAWMGFIPQATQWMSVQISRGEQSVLKVYQEVLGNNSNPSVGHIVSMWD